MSTNRAVIRPQRGHSTTRLGLDTSTYRVCFDVATVDFGFYPVAEPVRRPQLRRPLPTRSYTCRRGSTRPRDFHDHRPWGGGTGAQLLLQARGQVPHLPGAG